MTTNRPLRVFLCYSSADKPAVRELYQKLRAEPWIDPWLDEEDLYPGQDWNLEIEKAIESTDVILVFLSNNSINREGHVQREIRIALDYADYKPEETLFIIPIRLEECKPPRRLSRWHYADYFEEKSDRAFQRLLVSLKKCVETLGIIVDTQNVDTQVLSSNNKPSEKKEEINSVQVIINGDLIDTNITIGDGNTNIISRDRSGRTDYRQSISNAYIYLEAIKTEIDRENIFFAQKSLENVKNIILALRDENLSLEHEILECRCILKIEKVDEAREKFKDIAKRYPQDSRPLLHLAEICLTEDDLDGNSRFLEKAEALDADFWLLRLQKILRMQQLGEKIRIESIDEKTFPDDPKIRANFYRLYSLLLENSGDQTNADSFIAKSIHLNPDRFSVYLDGMHLIERRMLASQADAQRLQLSHLLLDEIEKVVTKFAVYGDIGVRNRLYINTKKINALLVQENFLELEGVLKDTFRFAVTCYFDRRIENIIVGVFKLVSLPNSELDQLLEYLKVSKKKISDGLSEVLICQFLLRDALYSKGVKFFEEIKNQKYVSLIHDLENGNHDQVLTFLQDNVPFSIALANLLKNSLALRKKIIEKLPDEKSVQKDKLELLLNFDEKDFDEAFQILKQLDLSNLDYFECIPILQIAQRKEAWDFEILILEKLLGKEGDKRHLFNLKSQLFNAYINSKKFSNAIDIGEELLREDVSNNFYNPRRQDALLSNTIYACVERGKIDREAFVRARVIIDWYQLKNPPFEFKAGVEAEVFLGLDNAEGALKSVVDGVKVKGLLSSHEYAKLYFMFVKIGNQIERLNTASLDLVEENTFVKLSNKDQWYFVGGEFELDAFLVSKTSAKYLEIFGKKVGDEVVFKNQKGIEVYRGEVELIYDLEKYVFWQSVQRFQNLAKDGDLEGVVMVEMPNKDGAVDLENIKEFFEESDAKTGAFFDLYCKNNYPLAMLAVSEGGLVNAIGRIQNENKGFIHFSKGIVEEFDLQKKIANKIINNKIEFYIDGTSALVLSETGLLQKIYKYLPNLKVPQSVISFLVEIAGRFRYIPGQTGYTMGYARGKITLSNLEQDRRELLQTNFVESVKLLEMASENIGLISLANKVDCFSEIRVPDELSDACILAQKENIPILTEDQLYLQLNELETKKKAPEYFSSWALISVLCERGFVTFNEYLDYFGYLSSYRFRFLHVFSNDIEKAIFSDGRNNPENIRRLNLPFLLSEDYGVSFDDAIRVVGVFLLNTIGKDAVSLDILKKITVEILNSFPTNKTKKEVGQILLDVCAKALEVKIPQGHYCRLEDKVKYQKIVDLLKFVDEDI